jgi:hypothetical protein
LTSEGIALPLKTPGFSAFTQLGPRADVGHADDDLGISAKLPGQASDLSVRAEGLASCSGACFQDHQAGGGKGQVAKVDNVRFSGLAVVGGMLTN